MEQRLAFGRIEEDRVGLPPASLTWVGNPAPPAPDHAPLQRSYPESLVPGPDAFGSHVQPAAGAPKLRLHALAVAAYKSPTNHFRLFSSASTRSVMAWMGLLDPLCLAGAATPLLEHLVFEAWRGECSLGHARRL